MEEFPGWGVPGLALAWALAVALYLPFDHRGWQFTKPPAEIASYSIGRASLGWLGLWAFSLPDSYGFPRDIGQFVFALIPSAYYFWWEGKRLGRARAAHLLLFIDGAAGQIEQWRYEDELEVERQAM